MTAAWVIGRRGLLGAAIEARLAAAGASLFVPPTPVDWSDRDGVVTRMTADASAFAAGVGPDADWSVVWAAGVGTMGSTAEAFAPETAALDALLDALAASGVDGARGTIVFASSAGAIYAGSDASVVDEATPIAPTTPYALAKLEHEARIASFARRTGASALLARITTLYGARQASGKPQGLLTHMARCIATQRPIHIFVSLDTVRDYIAVDDAADAIVASVAHLARGEVAVRIVASGCPVTISEIVGVFRHLTRRSPRIVTSAARMTALYQRRTRFRSRDPVARGGPRTTLVVGIAGLLATERLRVMTARR